MHCTQPLHGYPLNHSSGETTVLKNRRGIATALNIHRGSVGYFTAREVKIFGIRSEVIGDLRRERGEG